jgi:hypothetical protein
MSYKDTLDARRNRAALASISKHSDLLRNQQNKQASIDAAVYQLKQECDALNSRVRSQDTLIRQLIQKVTLLEQKLNPDGEQ